MNRVLPLLFFLVCCPRPVWSGDELSDLSELLSLAAAPAENFRGTFVCYAGADDSTDPPDCERGGMAEQHRGRAWVGSGQAVIEFFDASSEPSSESTGVDIREVLAKSDSSLFRFTAVESSVTQFANLRVHDVAGGINVQRQIDESLLKPLKAITEIAGFPITSVLASPDAEIEFDPVVGMYSVQAHSGGASPASISFQLTINGREVNSRARLEMGPTASQILVESAAEADHVESAIVPRRVVTRTSGPGYGPGRREVVIIEPLELPDIAHPITIEYFRKYQRDFPVVYGDAADTSEHVLAAVPQNSSGLELPGPAHDSRSDWTGLRRFVVVANLLLFVGGILLFLIRRRRNRHA